jgi:hypothetical protein
LITTLTDLQMNNFSHYRLLSLVLGKLESLCVCHELAGGKQEEMWGAGGWRIALNSQLVESNQRQSRKRLAAVMTTPKCQQMKSHRLYDWLHDGNHTPIRARAMALRGLIHPTPESTDKAYEAWRWCENLKSEHAFESCFNRDSR